MYKEVFNERMKHARKECNLSQRDVANKLKISKSTIASYETGRTEPDIETFAKLAVLYCHTLDYFVGLGRHAKHSFLRIRTILQCSTRQTHQLSHRYKQKKRLGKPSLLYYLSFHL